MISEKDWMSRHNILQEKKLGTTMPDDKKEKNSSKQFILFKNRDQEKNEF